LATNYQSRYATSKQRGAALVEFTITFMVFLIVILGIIEFALVIYDASRLAEATRAAARYAIVNTPACNIYGKASGSFDSGCISADGDIALACGANPNDSVTLSISDCGGSTTTPEGCMMVRVMDQMMLRLDNSIVADGAGEVSITYSCSGTGDPQLPNYVPVVTVAAENIQHPMMFTSIFGFYSPGGSGLGSSITLPRFETTRTGEDMYSN
jgi:hypothetical protein